MCRTVKIVSAEVESSAKMNFKHKKSLQTLCCAVLLAYSTLLVYHALGDENNEIENKIPINERPDFKPYYHDRNLAEDRSQVDYERPQEIVTEIPTATATAKPPSATLQDVFISVKTTKTYHNKRLPIILKTWFQLARKQTWFFTDTDDMEFQMKTNGHMINTNCSSSHSRKALCCKMSVEFDTFLKTDKKNTTAGNPDSHKNIGVLMCKLGMSNKCKPGKSSTVVLSVDDYGKFQDKEIKQFTWTNSVGTTIRLINYGGHITSICLPDKNGKTEDIVLGFNNLEGYLGPNNGYFGSTIGRFGNRISKGKMTIEGVEYNLAKNNGPNHLHGGAKGFDKVVWDYSIKEHQVNLSYLSPDMEENYPGTLLVNVTFELNCSNMFIINYKAMTTKTTVVNLTNHSYFNLAGDKAGAEELYNHIVNINAPYITAVDDGLIPTGVFTDVSGTAFDFQKPVRLGDVVNKVPNSTGFDHNFCISQRRISGKFEQFIASVVHPKSGRRLEVYSDLPAVQFYSGNFLPEDKSIQGKTGGYYQKHGAFCLETQNFPDSINHHNFPSPLLRPGEVYDTTTKFRFSVE